MCPTNNLAEIDSPLLTALYSLHTSLNGKMVVFAGYSMPMQFTGGIKAEHLHTRAHAGLFDVSHMGQIRITGDGAAAAMEKLVTGDITALQTYQQRYTLLTNSHGGIIDDLMVTRIPAGLFLVVNAAGKEDDYVYIKSSLPSTFQVELLQDRALLALQGPQAVHVLNTFTAEISHLGFMQAGHFRINGIDCFINRCGYTGEDGFELSVDNEQAVELAELLLENSEVMPVGLGARDSLRLEAGLCLYGHDINQTTSPVEANLQWTIARKYRNDSEEASFPGAELILKQFKEGTDRVFVGLRPEGKMPVREGVIILDKHGAYHGQVTSGGFGPSFGGPVAMGYVSSEYAQINTELQVEIRHRFHTMRVAELPFVLHRYYKP